MYVWFIIGFILARLLDTQSGEANIVMSSVSVSTCAFGTLVPTEGAFIYATTASNIDISDLTITSMFVAICHNILGCGLSAADSLISFSNIPSLTSALYYVSIHI